MSSDRSNRLHLTTLKVSKLIPPVFVVILAAVVSFNVSDRFQTELLSRFTADANSALQASSFKLGNYGDLLYSGRAFALSSNEVTMNEWRNFFYQQGTFTRYPGVSSIAYIKSVSQKQLPQFLTKMKSADYYGSSYAFKGLSSRDIHGFATSYVSQNNLSATEGLDVFANDSRLEIYQMASQKKTIVSSAPFKLASGYDGFFSVLPVYKDDTLDGYVITAFRFNELMKELFKDDSFGYKVMDVTDGTMPLYTSNNWQTDGNSLESTITQGGRRWKIQVSRPVDKRPVGQLLPAVIMTTGILLAISMFAYSNRHTLATKLPRKR